MLGNISVPPKSVAFLQVARLSTKLTTRITICSICAVSILLNIYPFLYYGVDYYTEQNKTYSYCNMRNKIREEQWNWISFRIGAFYLPTILVFIFTTAIITQLRRLAGARRELSSTVDAKAQKNERQLCTMLLLVATAFLILRLPYSICVIIRDANYDMMSVPSTEISRKALRIWLALDVTYCVAAVNYAINFFLFCFSGSLFRQKLFKTLKCQKALPATSGSSGHSRTSRFTISSASPYIKRSQFRMVPTTEQPHQSV